MQSSFRKDLVQQAQDLGHVELYIFQIQEVLVVFLLYGQIKF